MCVTFVLALQPRGYSRSSGLPTSLQRLDLETGTCWWIQRPVLWPSSAPSQGTQRALILLCQPLSTPAHYTTSWETSGVYFGIKMGQYLCGMWNNNNALWEYYTGPEKGGGLFIRNKSFAALPASDEKLFLSCFVETTDDYWAQSHLLKNVALHSNCRALWGISVPCIFSGSFCPRSSPTCSPVATDSCHQVPSHM